MPRALPGLRSVHGRLYASPHALLAITPLLWAINWIVGRGLHESPPFTMALVRWSVAALVMVPFCLGPLRRDWPVMRRHWRWVLVVALLGAGLGNVLTYVGLKYTTAINGAFLNSFVPVMIILLTRVVQGERLHRLQNVGVTVSLVGVLCIVTRGSIETVLGLRLNPGDFILLLSLLLWSFYTITLRGRPPQLDPMALLFAMALVAVAVLAPFAAVEFAIGRRLPLDARTLGALAFVGVFSSFVAYVFYNRGVERVGARVAGLYTHLMPVYSVLLAWTFLGERLALFHLVGIGLILGGVWLASRPRAKEAAGEAPPENPG
jgi:drug/metabolite transporter (DMT)-like permease